MSQNQYQNEGERYVAEYRANAARLEAAGVDLTEHDAPGILYRSCAPSRP